MNGDKKQIFKKKLYNRYSDNSIEINIKNRLQVPFKMNLQIWLWFLKKQSGNILKIKVVTQRSYDLESHAWGVISRGTKIAVA